MIPKLKEGYAIQEALDNLAVIAGIDLEAPPLIGLVQGRKIVTNEEEFGDAAVIWLSEETETLLEVMDTTYQTIHQYFMALSEDTEIDWDDLKVLRGIGSMMALVGESSEMLERYIAFRMDRKGITVKNRPEYRSLVDWYQGHFAKKIQVEEVKHAPPVEMRLDFESVKRDRDYELFSIRREDGTFYYDGDLIRNLKISVDFEVGEDAFEEDPLLKLRGMQDRDLQASARQILNESQPFIEKFYAISKKMMNHQLASCLKKALIALFLASNPRNLLQNTVGKSCMQYYDDFHKFLRQAMKTPEYQKMIAYPPESTDETAYGLLNAVHALCYSFFSRAGGIKQESIGLIHRTMRKGEKSANLPKGESVWNQLLFDDEKLRVEMAKFPNGPLFKILDVIREAKYEERVVPFDPIGEQNFPLKLFDLDYRGKRIHVLRIPSPTSQAFINKVELLDEFRGYLRSLSLSGTQKKLLMVNLQDRNSWKESSRCRMLEQLQKNAEFSQSIYVMTLPKSTDFYYQTQEYLDRDDAQKFLSAFQSKLASPEEHGFFFPAAFKTAELAGFSAKILPLIHREFFGGKKTLTRRQREDFIEIFYQFLVLKALDFFQADAISFTCKDALDIGAAAQGLFFAFAQLFQGSLDSREEVDFFRWLLYAPAFLHASARSIRSSCTASFPH